MSSGAQRGLGQHFLEEGSPAVARILGAAALRPGERVLEAGGGTGALTAALAEAVGPSGRVTAVELDPELADGLRMLRAANVDVVEGDALRVPWPRPLDAVVANPPFQILSPLLLRIADERLGRAVLVVPRELRDRMVADAGTECYGKLTVRLALRGASESLFFLSRHAFTPPPEVPSCVVRFTPHAKPMADLELADKVLDVAWENRKKTLRHALSPLAKGLGLPPQDVTDAHRLEGVSGLTPEQTSVRIWGAVVNRLAGSLARRKGAAL